MIVDPDEVCGEAVVKSIKKEGGYVRSYCLSSKQRSDVNESLIVITPAAGKRFLSSATFDSVDNCGERPHSWGIHLFRYPSDSPKIPYRYQMQV